MAQTNTALSLSTQDASADVVREDVRSFDEVETLLAQAAELAAAHGIETETFMNAAWTAALDARPGLREEIEEKELKTQLKKLRKRGLIGQA